MSTMKCPSCKKTIAADSLFCSYCEYEIVENQVMEVEPTQVISLQSSTESSSSIKESLSSFEDNDTTSFDLNDYTEPVVYEDPIKTSKSEFIVPVVQETPGVIKNETKEKIIERNEPLKVDSDNIDNETEQLEKRYLKEEDFFSEEDTLPKGDAKKKVLNFTKKSLKKVNEKEEELDSLTGKNDKSVYDPNHDGYYDDKLAAYEDDITGLISKENVIKALFVVAGIIVAIVFLITEL